MTRRRMLPLIVALVLVGAVAVWRPWDRCDAPGPLCTALASVRELPGVVDAEVDYAITAADAKDGDSANASWTVELAADLDPAEAGAAARSANRIIEGLQAPPDQITHFVQLVAGEQTGSVPVYPLSVNGGDRVAERTAQAYDLRRAGAIRVADDSAWVATAADLLPLAEFAADRGFATTLDTVDGSARYESREMVRPEDVRLVVEAAGLADVEKAILTGDHALLVHTSSAGDSTRTAAVQQWLDRRTPPGREPLAYTLTSPGYADIVEGWLGDVRPPPRNYTQPLPEGVEPWPKDPSAPDCAAEDLELGLSGPGAALGSRFLAVLARNVSDRSCSVDGFPTLRYFDDSGDEQSDVTTTTAPGLVAARVVIPAGERAIATTKWSAMSTANDPDVTTAVEVAALPDSEPVRLVPQTEGEDASLDVLDGAEVTVGPWAQAVEGWSS